MDVIVEDGGLIWLEQYKEMWMAETSDATLFYGKDNANNTNRWWWEVQHRYKALPSKWGWTDDAETARALATATYVLDGV